MVLVGYIVQNVQNVHANKRSFFGIVKKFMQENLRIKGSVCYIRTGRLNLQGVGVFKEGSVFNPVHTGRCSVLLVSLGLVLVAPTGYAQKSGISGTVRDMNTHLTVPFVNVYNSRTGEGCSTGIDGSYTFDGSRTQEEDSLRFSHVSYESRWISAGDLKKNPDVFLTSRMIPFEPLTVTGNREFQPSLKDLPQTMSIMKSADFESKGFSDAADLLKSDPSIQTQESLSGQKTVSMRGGNPDEVLVLFNGVRLNRNFDNQTDLSQFDVQDLEKIEIIRGSNTVVYGPDAFSGVINLVPRFSRDYSLRFRQEFGPYGSGKWGLHFHQEAGPAFGSASYKTGAMSRPVKLESGETKSLINSENSQLVSVGFRLGEKEEDGQNLLKVNWLRMHSFYNNQKEEEINTGNTQVFIADYQGDTWFLGPVNLIWSSRYLDEKFDIAQSSLTVNRSLTDRANVLSLSKSLDTRVFSLTFSGMVELAEVRVGDGLFTTGKEQRKNSELGRLHTGFATLLRHDLLFQPSTVEAADLSLSMRFDSFDDDRSVDYLSDARPIDIPAGKRHWEGTVVKFSTGVRGKKDEVYYFLFLNFGKNIKFPSLYNQVQRPFGEEEKQFKLVPEKNESFDFGIKFAREFSGHPLYSGWELSTGLFRNWYQNKIREIQDPVSPVQFFDNINTASITGLEAEASVFLLSRKVSVSGGASYYNITEKLAFPFKSAHQRNLSATVDHEGYSILARWFYEGEQAGWVRGGETGLAEVVLPSYFNLDIHLSKNFQTGAIKSFLSLSLRNILDTEYVYQGLTLRDRRFYLIFGVQY